MQSIRSSNTRMEVLVRKQLWSRGAKGYRLHHRKVIGKPDIAFTRAKVAIFLDGCFWHGCPNCYKEPTSNTDFWRKKLNYNKERDERYTLELGSAGWIVLRYWECEIANDLPRIISEVVQKLDWRLDEAK